MTKEIKNGEDNSFNKGAFPSGEIIHNNQAYQYFIVPANFNPDLSEHDFFFSIPDSIANKYIIGISENVPAQFRPYWLLPQIIHLNGVARLEAETLTLQLIPEREHNQYIETRKKLFGKLVGLKDDVDSKKVMLKTPEFTEPLMESSNEILGALLMASDKPSFKIKSPDNKDVSSFALFFTQNGDTSRLEVIFSFKYDVPPSYLKDHFETYRLDPAAQKLFWVSAGFDIQSNLPKETDYQRLKFLEDYDRMNSRVIGLICASFTDFLTNSTFAPHVKVYQKDLVNRGLDVLGILDKKTT